MRWFVVRYAYGCRGVLNENELRDFVKDDPCDEHGDSLLPFIRPLRKTDFNDPELFIIEEEK